MGIVKSKNLVNKYIVIILSEKIMDSMERKLDETESLLKYIGIVSKKKDCKNGEGEMKKRKR